MEARDESHEGTQSEGHRREGPGERAAGCSEVEPLPRGILLEKELPPVLREVGLSRHDIERRLDERLTWEYRLEPAPDAPALHELGEDGWELAGVGGGNWIFRRPGSTAAERFTREQRVRALEAAPGAPVPRLLHPEVAALVRRVQHTQMLLLADRGYPVPPLAHVIDLALTSDVPTIPQVLEAIGDDLPADRWIAAVELQSASPERWACYGEACPRVEAVPHLQFKRLAREAVGCIRTGDSTPYSNLLIVGG